MVSKASSPAPSQSSECLESASPLGTPFSPEETSPYPDEGDFCRAEIRTLDETGGLGPLFHGRNRHKSGFRTLAYSVLPGPSMKATAHLENPTASERSDTATRGGEARNTTWFVEEQPGIRRRAEAPRGGRERWGPDPGPSPGRQPRTFLHFPRSGRRPDSETIPPRRTRPARRRADSHSDARNPDNPELCGGGPVHLGLSIRLARHGHAGRWGERPDPGALPSGGRPNSRPFRMVSEVISTKIT